jgi:hypothetical protein
MSPLNEAIAYYDPGDDLTGQATAAITGRRFLRPTAAKQVGSQALANDTFGGSIPVAHSGAGLKPLAVSVYDAAIGEKLPIARGHKVFPVEAGGAMTAGDSVMSDATGRAVTWTSAASEANARAGMVLNSPTAAGQTAIVALDL